MVQNYTMLVSQLIARLKGLINMAKVFFNYDNLRYNCVDNIREVTKYLDDINRYFSSMNIPYNYAKRQDLINAKETLERCNSDLKKIMSWIVNSNNQLENKIDTYNDRASRLPSNCIKRRNQRI